MSLLSRERHFGVWLFGRGVYQTAEREALTPRRKE
jgi:hypothetical protein